DPYRNAAVHMERVGGAAAVDGNFEMVGAAEERTHVAAGDLRIRRDHAGNRVRPDANVESGAGCELLERLPVDVRDQVAEAIDAKDLAVDPAVTRRRLRNGEADDVAGRTSEGGELDPFREPRGRGRKPSAPLERLADRRPQVTPLAQFDHFLR